MEFGRPLSQPGFMAGDEFDQMAMVHRLPRASVVNRIEFLAELVSGRRVVHIGFADAGCRQMQAGAGTWLHAHLAARAASLIGLDVDEDGVDAARQAGYTAYVADCRILSEVTALGLDPADLVVAGEVIEHLDAPGAFLDALTSLVRPGGLLVLTTPNASGLGNALAALAGYEINHPDHVTLFSCRTLMTMLERHGWTTIEVRTYVPILKPKANLSGRLRLLRAGAMALLWLQRTAGHLGRPFAADGLIMVARSTGT